MDVDRRAFFKGGAGVLGAGALSLMGAGNASAASVSPGISWGSRGSAVKNLQNRLNSLGYWCGGADGVFGGQTHQAVMAVQKAAGLARDGVVGNTTAAKINAGVRPKARVGGSGRHIEIDKARQLALFVENGAVKLIANTSTGGGYLFPYQGRQARAVTPSGSFRIYSRWSGGWQNGVLGRMYRPVYFNGGIAIHGSDSIPASPVSHGCCRVSNSFMDMLWRSGWVNSGTSVRVY